MKNAYETLFKWLYRFSDKRIEIVEPCDGVKAGKMYCEKVGRYIVFPLDDEMVKILQKENEIKDNDKTDYEKLKKYIKVGTEG